jgi:hypothetical protein
VIKFRIELIYDFYLWNCESHTSVTFELDSKSHRIEEYAFRESGLKAIHVYELIEVICKWCLLSSKSRTPGTFWTWSKSCEVTTDIVTRSPRLCPIEYLPSLYDRSWRFLYRLLMMNDSFDRLQKYPFLLITRHTESSTANLDTRVSASYWNVIVSLRMGYGRWILPRECWNSLLLWRISCISMWKSVGVVSVVLIESVSL